MVSFQRSLVIPPVYDWNPRKILFEMSETNKVRGFDLKIDEMNKKGGEYNAKSTEIKKLRIFHKNKSLNLENIHSAFLENIIFKLYQPL